MLSSGFRRTTRSNVAAVAWPIFGSGKGGLLARGESSPLLLGDLSRGQFGVGPGRGRPWRSRLDRGGRGFPGELPRTFGIPLRAEDLLSVLAVRGDVGVVEGGGGQRALVGRDDLLDVRPKLREAWPLLGGLGHQTGGL